VTRMGNFRPAAPGEKLKRRKGKKKKMRVSKRNENEINRRAGKGKGIYVFGKKGYSSAEKGDSTHDYEKGKTGLGGKISPHKKKKKER